MRSFVEFLLTPAKIFKTLLLWATNQHHLRVIISIFYFIGTCMKIWEAVLKSLSGRKRYINLDFFCNFSLQSFGSVKLTVIPGRTANTTFCFPKTCNLSAVNKKLFLDLVTKHLKNFEFTFQNESNFENSGVSRKN